MGRSAAQLWLFAIPSKCARQNGSWDEQNTLQLRRSPKKAYVLQPTERDAKFSLQTMWIVSHTLVWLLEMNGSRWRKKPWYQMNDFR